MDRASDSGSESRGFESLRARCIDQITRRVGIVHLIQSNLTRSKNKGFVRSIVFVGWAMPNPT